MKKVIISLCLLLGLIATSTLTISCEGGKKKVPTLGKSQSAPYELLLVANKEWLKTMAGQSLSVVLNSPIEGLPQPETHFRLTTVNPQDFDGTFRLFANVIQVKIGKDYPEAKVTMIHDAFCKPQLIINIEAPNDEEFITLIRERAELILSMFDDCEITRERGLLQKHFSGKVQTEAKKQFGIGIKAPQAIDQIKSGKNFFWGSDENEFRLNVCVYSVPLRNMDEAIFVATRDSVMKINIPGDRDDQWMETDSRTISSKQLELEESGAVVTTFRGLWYMRNDAMGGPFVSYVYTDTEHQRLIIAEGFIFAPQKEKRAMIRELEAAMQTITLQ